MWNDIETKCVVHQSDIFDSSTTKEDVIRSLVQTPTLSKEQKTRYIQMVNKTVDLKSIIEEAAEAAVRQDI